MANKTLYPFGVGGQTPSGIEIIDDLTTGGSNKALSAEQGKELAKYVFMGSGTYGDAYDASKTTTTYFPWLLIDEDENGVLIKKMIWHVGNGAFIDAIGTEITGIKNGITIKASGDGYVSFKGGGLTTAGQLDYINGEVNYSFFEIANILKTANAASTSTYNGKSVSEVNSSTSPSTLEIDFGGVVVTPSSSSLQKFTVIKRMNIGTASLWNVFEGNTRLVKLQISGIATDLYKFCNSSGSWSPLQEVDASGLTINGDTRMQSAFACEPGSDALVKVDIRGLDTSSVKDMSGIFFKRRNLKTLIIGNFSTASATSYTNAFSTVSGATLVCTADTPPTMHSTWNFITDHFSVIKVPNKTVEINGEEVTVLSLYQAAAGWSTHANKMSTYEVGEY